MKDIMKNIQFLGNSLECIREFPDDARREAGYQLSRVQQGLQPDDFRSCFYSDILTTFEKLQK